MVALTPVTRRQPKMIAVTLDTLCQPKARLRASTLATAHQLQLMVRRRMQGIRCQLKPSPRPAVLANLRRQHTQVIKWHRLQSQTRTRVIKWRRCQSPTHTQDIRWARKKSRPQLLAQSLQMVQRVKRHTNSISNKQKRRRNEAYHFHTITEDFQSFTGCIGSSRMLDAV
ncbi:hypothetical protein GCM10009094_07940 [Massilia aurea]